MGIKPFTIGILEDNSSKVKEPDDGSILIDFSKPIETPILQDTSIENIDSNKRKRGRPKKDQGPVFTDAPHMTTQIASDFNTENNKSKRDLSFMESNEPYEKKYQETTNILRSAILQLDNAMMDLQSDIQQVRLAKTMRGKWQYLPNMQKSLSDMISNKIAAARELNNTISKCNELEIKRFKEVKSANAASDQDDDQRVMEMYKAFVSTPVSQNPFPNISQMAVAGSPTQVQQIGSSDNGFNAYMTNLTPKQNSMYIESDPNIQQVVVYNQETGARYFDVIDMTTGQSVPNAEKHDTMFLEDTTIDLKNKVARNVNIGETYPLVIVGQPLMQEY